MFVDEKAAGEAKPIQVGTLKLSTAIRIGARKRPQAFRSYFVKGASCAFGAAHEGSGGEYNEFRGMIAHDLMQKFAISSSLGKEVIERNDRGESRESIADWLEAQGY